MEKLLCDICDGELKVYEGGKVICAICGVEYTVEAMQEKCKRDSETKSTNYNSSEDSIISQAKVYEEVGEIDTAERLFIQYLSSNPQAQGVRVELNRINEIKDSLKREGTVLKGKVIEIREFGVFIEFYKGYEGMVHISQLSNSRLNHCTDVCQIGDYIWVKCRGLDKMGRLSYSAKECSEMNGF